MRTSLALSAFLVALVVFPAWNASAQAPAKPDPPAPLEQANELPAPKPAQPAEALPGDVPAAQPAEGGAQALPVPAGENADRFKWHNGRWWYLNNSNRWIYYRDGQWWPNPADVKAGTVANAPLSPASHSPNKLAAPAGATDNNWRMVKHDGRWWYLMPDETWNVYLNNKWVKYDPTTFEMITAQQMASQRAAGSYGRSYSTARNSRYYRSPSYYNRGFYGPSFNYGYGSPWGYGPGSFSYPGFGYPYGYGGFGGYPYGGGSGIRIGIGFN